MSEEKLKRVFEVSESLDDLDETPIEDVLEDLRERGLDPNPLIKFAHQRLAGLRGPAKLAEAKAKRERLEQLRERAKAMCREQRPTMRDDILALIAKNAPELSQVYHRKFQAAKDEDLASLLDDLEFLDAADKESDGSSS